MGEADQRLLRREERRGSLLLEGRKLTTDFWKYERLTSNTSNGAVVQSNSAELRSLWMLFLKELQLGALEPKITLSSLKE